MKTLHNLRNFKMNTSLRSILGSSLIAITMMSCTKQDIQPATVNSTETARMSSNRTMNPNASTAIDAQTLININLAATASDPSYRIMITNDATVQVVSRRQDGKSFISKLDAYSFAQVLELVKSAGINDQDYTSANQNGLPSTDSEAYSATNENAFQNNQSEAYTATNSNAFQNNQSEAYTATNSNAFQNNQSEAYTATNTNAFQHNQSEAYTPSGNSALTINEVQFRSCTTCNPMVYNSNNDAQARIRSNNFIDQLYRLINLQGLIDRHKGKVARG